MAHDKMFREIEKKEMENAGRNAGIAGASFKGRGRPLNVPSKAPLIKKIKTASEASQTLRKPFKYARNQPCLGAPTGHTPSHAPHSMQVSASI